MIERRKKIVHDPLHGSISIDGVFLDILDRHEVQRLHAIKQLGLGNMVFPGANHTRFEHSMGVYHLAGRMTEALGMDEEESNIVRAAALLHDVCHPPFSHTMEEIMENETGLDHMDLARKLIHGSIPTFLDRDDDILGGVEPISELLERNGVSPGKVCDLIAYPVSKAKGLEFFTAVDGKQSFFASKDYAHQIIHGPVDADQMDYLVRDAHYTGVSHGSIDTERLLNKMRIHNNKIVLEKGGIVAAEGLMVSRALMYSSVYFHKTVRIVEMMLTKAAEVSDMDFSRLYLMDDTDLISCLIDSTRKASEITRSVLHRRFYKNAYTLYSIDLSDDVKAGLVKYSDYGSRKSLESEIADRAGIDPSEVIVDIPSKSTLLSNIRIGKTDVSILEDDKVRSITKFSPLARALQSRDISDWAIMISAPADRTESVRKAAKDILAFDDAERSEFGNLAGQS
ncbi:MAG: HD domain-containing protein [Candidatus Methanomethylophilaceae archaeon]